MRQTLNPCAADQENNLSLIADTALLCSGAEASPLGVAAAPLSTMLRTQTACLHRQIEVQLGLPFAIQNLDDYRGWLSRFLGLYGPLEQALAGFTEWRDHGLTPPNHSFRLGADLEAIGVDPAGVLQAPLAGTLEADGFPPSVLSLEVTDNILTDIAGTAVLAEIRKLGVRVAIDDFGIAHSSRQFLRRLQADEVKLDRRFFDDVTNDNRGTVLVGAVIALVHAAGMSVAFEGIETQAEADLALAAGADIVQGLFFAPPLSASAAEDFVRRCLESEVRRTPMPQHEA